MEQTKFCLKKNITKYASTKTDYIIKISTMSKKMKSALKYIMRVKVN